MVLDMVTHHESAMNDRLSGKSRPVSETPPHNMAVPNMVQYENVAEDQPENVQHHQNQAKIVGKEVCGRGLSDTTYERTNTFANKRSTARRFPKSPGPFSPPTKRFSFCLSVRDRATGESRRVPFTVRKARPPSPVTFL